jgi:tripartite-type tricarboxylate transporter receptor subunit TctC
MIRRRSFLAGCATAFMTATTGVRVASAEAGYPTRPVRLLIPSQAGGVYDLMGRIWAERIAPALGTVVVENRAGGSATVGVAAAAKSAPDGYTLLLASNATHILQPAMMTTPPYDPVNDFVVISALTASWTAIVVTPSVPAKSLSELINYARANPGKLNFGYSGVGDTTHIAGELFKQLANGLEIVGVPYRGMAPAVRELVSGHLQMAMPHITSQITELHRNGQVRILAINSPKRIAAAPDIPTASEAGLPEMTAATYFYLYAPAGTPRPILEKINRLTQEALTDQAFRTKLVNAGFDPMVVGDLDKSAAFAKSEHARWTPIAQKTGIKIN